MKTKGQFFVIAAIIIAVSLVMIRGLISVYPASEVSANENTKLSDRQLENIESDYEQLTGMAILQQNPNQSLAAYMPDFSTYLRNSEDSKILWIAIVSNGTDQNYYVTAGNYLQSDIELTLNFTASAPSGISMHIPDKSYSSATFAATANGTINMTVAYELDGSVIQDVMQFPVSTRDIVTGYFDISLVSKNSKTRTKDVYTAIKQ